MRQSKFYLIFICLLLSTLNYAFAQKLRSYSPDDGVFYLKTGDGHEEYTVEGTVTFKCVKSGNIPGYRDAGVTFAPSNAGEVIQVKVEEIDLDGSTNYLLLYHGYIKTGYTGASSGGAQSTYMPVGWFEKIGKSAEGNVYTSESIDGKLTFGFHSSGANGQKGFNITVTSYSPKDMEFVSAGAILDGKSVNRGSRNQILLGANIKMDGGSNPHTLNELVFNTSSLTADQVENLRIYSSDKFTEANLLTSVPAIGTTISYNGDIVLHSGDNNFYVVADIKPDASGTIPQISLTSVKINNEAKVVSPATSENPVTVGNDILIAKEHLTYTISNNVNFYDDGGKDGKISEKFEGTITFVPSTAGKKIKIDFSKFEIFNTSSVGYNDVFKFYNGQAVNEDNLIATLLKEAKIIKSTAEDGSLTVTLKSVTGVPANGWEAVVSEFVPGPMTFDALEISQISNETVAAGNTDEAFILLNIKTTNTQDPLALQSIYLDATATTNLSALDKANVYFLGEKSTLNLSNLFGQTSVTGTSIKIDGNRQLVEGNNYFAVLFDITSAASNEDIISASVNKVTISGEDKAPESILVANRTVANTFKAKSGNHVREFHDTWTYTDTKSPYSSTLYNYEDTDCYVTFKPTVEGAMAEIDFSSFDVYYANAISGVKATFEVYSGTTLTSDNLIWKLSDNSQSKTGPQKKLRSTAADGSITIKFNAKTTSSYYAGTGWTATVTPFINHEMTVESVNAFQNNTNNLKPSATNQEVIGFSVTTEGNLTTQTVKEVKIDLKNSDSVANKVSILYSADLKDFSKGVLFGSTNELSNQEITINGEQALPEGISYFWVAYDIKDVVPTDVQVDAKLVSVKTDEPTPYIPENGDPDGFRLTKNEYLLESGNNGQVTIHNPILFYDDGGADNEYSLNFDGQITFMPSASGEVVKMTFNSFRSYSSHYFYIYEGTEVNEDNLIGRYSSTTFPTSLFSKSEDGAITVRFVSTSSGYTYAGWEIRVESYIPQALSVEEIVTTPATTSDVLRGSKKAAMQQIAVKVGGDKGRLSLNNFKFENTGTTNVSDILSAELYYTNTSSGFIADNQVGNAATASTYVFTSSNDIEVTLPGTYYFWLTYNIDANATADNKVAASLSEIFVDGASNTTITESALSERNIKAGFKGNYIIGKSTDANYATFASAITAMQDGVEGAVEFKVEAGTYAENIKVMAIQGTSEEHDIVFTSLSGDNDDVIVTGAGYSEPPYGGQKYGMVAIDSTSYVTFENMSFIPTAQTYPNAIHLLHASRYFTLRNCIIQANPVLSGYEGMNLFRMEARNVEGNNNDYATIENNTLSGGYIALYMGGTGYVALTKERGAVIRNNTITNAGSKGIYLMDEENALIENNTVISSVTQKTGYIGLDIYRNRGALVIRNNKIVNNQAYYSTGINLRQELMGTAEKPALVYNNSIAITAAPNTSTYGIDIVSDCSYISLYNNTVNITGTAGYAFGISKTYTTIKGIILENNLMQVNTASPVFYINNNDTHLKALTLKNNAYYTAGVKFASYGGDDFAAWKTKTGDSDSFVEQAVFISSSDLHLKEQGALNAANPLSFISEDADGKVRSLTSPTIGAYEYEAIVEVKPEIEESYPKTGVITYNSIEFKTKWNQSGSLYGTIIKASEEAPTESELLATTAISLSSGVEHIWKFTSLDEETEYKAYFIFVSALDIKSDISTTDVAKTLKQIFPLSVTLPKTWSTITAGDEVVLYPIVSGAVYPYSYEWKNQMNQVISNDSILTVSPDVVQQYRLTVTSNDNQTKTNYTDIVVRGRNVIATFEDNHLEPESYWRGLEDDGESKFYSGSYSFTNTHYPSMDYWGGFGYSNVTDTSFDPNEYLTHQFRSVVGTGAEGSDTYSIVYTMGARTRIDVIHSEEGMTIPGVYLTNAAYTLNSMQNGDSFAGDPFKEGDYYKLTFKGTTATKATNTIEYYLADYRSANEAEHYMITDWKWFDLSCLGDIISLTISADGSRKGIYGLDTPAYFCMDNLGAISPNLVGVDTENVNNLHVYPVPASDILNISTSYTDYVVNIYNLQGQVVKTISKQTGQVQLDVTILPAGNYILELISTEGRQIRNFIKK